MLKPPESILIILMGSIGDVVRGLSLVEQIKHHWPRVRLGWLVEPRCEEIVRAHPGIDQVIVFERKKGILGLPRLYSQLKSSSFEVVLDLQRHFKSGFFSFLSRAPRRIGFAKNDSKEFNWIFQTERIPEFGDNLPKIKHYLAFIEKLGLAVNEPLSFGIDQFADKHILQDILGHDFRDYIVFVLGSAWTSKDWSLEGYYNLAKLVLTRLPYQIVLAGDKTQIKMADELGIALKSERIIDKVGKTTLGEVSTIIKGAKCVIGPDSGPGHIAGALNVPYISLFGPTDPIRTAPYGSEKLVIKSNLACMPCYRKKCPGLDRLCMRLIKVDDVMQQIISILQTNVAQTN